MLDVGCGMLDVRCGMLDVGCALSIRKKAERVYKI
jgi:hypothetical protein